ncbi:MAG: hypothetical protein HYY96_01180 [Candidatus Tectomicrobia bacterium]|nr:hypothetical protein [Candidatus Tectomicrobia bacterium]
MRIAIRKADNAAIPDFQTPGPAPGVLAESVASRYGGGAADYLEVEAPVEMIEPIMARTHDPLWDGQALSLALHVKTQAELNAEAEAARLATLRQNLRSFDFSTVTDLAAARNVLRDLRDVVIR